MTGKTKQVVLVTGSSGFLGQHIVKLLQENDSNVTEIRLFDIVPYENKLGHAESKPTKEFVGDVLKPSDLKSAFEGVDCVIHAAAVVDFRMFPDHQKMREVNVEGTKNVLDACKEQNVGVLIYCSSADVVAGGDPVLYGAENTTYSPRRFLMGTYSETKRLGEKMVLEANGVDLGDGRKLRTASLRPTLMYGEGDQYFVTYALKVAKHHGGVLKRIASIFVRIQPTYVGNAAWAFLKAKDKLVTDDSAAGEDYFVTDDTPIVETFDFLETYTKPHGYRVTEKARSYWLIYLFLLLISMLNKLFGQIYKPSYDLPSPGFLSYVCSVYFFNNTKAILRLDYDPLYTPEESQTKSLEYYKKLAI